MPHGLTTTEVAHVATHHATPSERRRREELIEIVEAALLAVVAVATAWSGYQAARWDGHQAQLYGVAARDRVLATAAQTRSGQERLYDTTTFNFWLQAKGAGDRQTVRLFEKRFRPEFQPAFVAWKKTNPFVNPEAPPGPTWMPEYRNAAAATAVVFEHRANEAFAEGTEARETGEKYVRNTVLLATVLFLTALAQRFKIMAVRLSLLGVSGVLLVFCLYYVVNYPRA